AAPTGPGTDYARKLIENPKRARGAYAPDFQVVTQTGDSLSSQSLAGKIVVLDFWATWCPPCRASLPELKELTKKYSSSNVVLLSLSADDNEIAWRDFISKKQMNWPQYWDKDHHMFAMVRTTLRKLLLLLRRQQSIDLRSAALVNILELRLLLVLAQ